MRCKLNVDDYRGIAIQSAIPKLFKPLVYELYPWLESKMKDHQQRFLEKGFIVTNLTGRLPCRHDIYCYIKGF